MKKIKLLLLTLGVFALTLALLPTETSQIETDYAIEQVSQLNEEVIMYQASIFGDMDGDNIITWIVGIFGTIFAGAFAFMKKKISKIATLFKELYEGINAVDKALEDDNLSKAELVSIKKELKDIVRAFKDLIAKDEK